MTEVWKSVSGYEGLYEISSHGRVKVLARTAYARNRWGGITIRDFPERVMSPGANKAGYLHVTFRKDGEDKTFLVHRLVASAFVVNSKKAETVNHIDGIKGNNDATNLEWVSQKENNHHARVALPFRQHRHAVKATAKDGTVLHFKSKLAAEVALLGRPTGIVSKALQGGKQAIGFVWSQE